MATGHRVGIIRGGALVAGAALAVLEWLASPNADRTVLLFDVTVGLAFVVAAVITLGVESAKRIGYLWLACGLAWFAGAFLPIASAGYLGFLTHLLVTFPVGRLERRFERLAVAAG